MLYFNRRELKIIKLLLNEAAFSASYLSNQIKVSNKTIHNDVMLINSQFTKSNFEIYIEQERVQGYIFKFSSRDVFDKFALQVKKICSMIAVKNYSNDRIPIILRAFYLADDYIKGEEFEFKFNISDTTLTSDLKEVRKVLKKYDLEIETTPYYGMRLIGREMSKISMFIDHHDLYEIDNKYYLSFYFYKETEVNKEEGLQAYQGLSLFMNQNHIRINEENLLDASVLLMVLLKKEGKNISDTNFETTLEPKISFRKKCEISLGINSRKNLTHFIEFIYNIVDLEPNNLNAIISKNERNPIYSSKLIKLLEEETNINLNNNQKIIEYIYCLERRIHESKSIGYYRYKVNDVKFDLLKYLNISNTIAFIIYFHFLDSMEQTFFYDWFINLSLTIYNTAYIIPNEYEKVDVLVVNAYGRYFNESFIYRSDLNLANMSPHFHYEHELEHLNLNNYAAILTVGTKLKNRDKFDIPVFDFEYFVQQKEYKRLWNSIVLTHKRDNFISKQLEMEKIDFDSNVKSSRELISELNESIPLQKSVYKKHEQYWYALQKDIANNSRGFYWIILQQDKSKSNIFKTKVTIQEKTIPFTKITLSLSDNFISIKQAESLIRRMMNENSNKK